MRILIILALVIGGSECFVAADMSSTYSSMSGCASRTVPINISSSTTYKVRFECNSTVTTQGYMRIWAHSITGGLTNDDNNSNIWAIRIA